MHVLIKAYVDGVIKNVLIECNTQSSDELFSNRLEQLIQKHRAF